MKIGIHIDKLSFQDYKVYGLYIKLDKKLIVKSQKVHIPKTKAKPSFNSVEDTFNNIKEVLEFFEYIELDSVEFENNNLVVVYSDSVLYISTKDYEISAIVKKNDKVIRAEVTNLYIRRSDINIYGSLIYDLKDNKLETKGNFFFLNSSGKFTMIKDKKEIKVSLSSGKFQNIKKLLEPWEIPESINSWIVDRVRAKEYKLDYFKIYASIDENSSIVPHFDTIDAKATLGDVEIKFKDGVDVVESRYVDILYRDNNLTFLLDKPTYKDRDIEGSRVEIDNLVGEKRAVLKVDLKLKTVVDDEVHKILKAYKLNIPIYTKKIQNININIEKPLYKGSKVDVRVESNITKDNFQIAKVPLDITSGYVLYKDKKVYLSNIELKNRIYDIKSKGVLDSVKKELKLKNYIKKLTLTNKKKKKIVDIHKQSMDMSLSYRKDIVIKIPKYSTNITYKKGETHIRVDNLKRVLKYIHNLPLSIYGGSLDIYTKDFLRFKFIGNLLWSECFFYIKDNQCMSKIPCKGSIYKERLKFYAFGKKIYIDNAKSIIKLNNINIDIEKFFNSQRKKISLKGKKVELFGNNSTIRYRDYHLLTDSYDVTIYPNGVIKAIGSLDGDVVKFDKKGKNISIKAYRVKDRLLHPLINFDGLKSGRYTFKSEGNPDKSLKGEILIEGGVLKDFKAYSNTLAFINSIPALATFSNPGFSEKGYIIKEGMVLYRKVKDIVYFDTIYIKGSSANIAGKGKIDLKSKKIDISLAIQVAKDFGKIIGNIPLVGYILMGEDKSMTLGLRITGTLDKAKVETSVAKDILSLPFEMLKRTFGG